jgi:hypothetical protein
VNLLRKVCAANECFFVNRPWQLLTVGERLGFIGFIIQSLLQVDIFDATKPEEIFVSSIVDNHPDHRVLAELARELARAHRDRVPALCEMPTRRAIPRCIRQERETSGISGGRCISGSTAARS